MKKYSRKNQLNQKPNFDNEIKDFIDKIDFTIDKKMLNGVLHNLFDVIQTFDVDMWAIKSHLKENMQKVNIYDFNERERVEWNGLYEYIDNYIEVSRAEFKNSVLLCEVITHELLHCISSFRSVSYTKAPHATKQKDITALTGLSGAILDENDYENFYLLGTALITEGITQHIANAVINKHFGNFDDRVYFFPKKLVSQLYSVLGNDLIKGYFENDFNCLNNLFLPNKQLEKFMPKASDDFGLKDYMQLLETVFEIYSYPYEFDTNTCFYFLYLLNVNHLKFFQKHLIEEFYKNKDSFLSGQEVKETLLKSFILYAKDISLHFVSNNANKYYKEIWIDYINIIDETYAGVCKMFKNKYVMPIISNKEISEKVTLAQKFCDFNYYGKNSLELNDITKVRNVNLDYELEKYKKISDKKYKLNKFKPNVFVNFQFTNDNKSNNEKQA